MEAETQTEGENHDLAVQWNHLASDGGPQKRVGFHQECAAIAEVSE